LLIHGYVKRVAYPRLRAHNMPKVLTSPSHSSLCIRSIVFAMDIIILIKEKRR
jgi:hypothetical protein